MKEKEKEKKESTAEEREKNIEELISSLQGKFGEGSIMKLGDAKKVNVDIIPTGSF